MTIRNSYTYVGKYFLVIGPSKILKNQRGVIAKKNYKKGELLFTIKGPILKNRTKYSFAIDLNLNIEPQSTSEGENFGHYTNHSCDPNAFIRIVEKDSKNPYPYIEVAARKAIKKGEEITVDYASFEYNTSVDGLRCRCDQRKCRGEISGFKDLPFSIRENYKKEGIISNYLIKLYNKDKKYDKTT